MTIGHIRSCFHSHFPNEETETQKEEEEQREGKGEEGEGKEWGEEKTWS